MSLLFENKHSQYKENKELEMLNKLKPGEVFIKKYSAYDTCHNKIVHEYSLMKRTKCRIWDPNTERHFYTDEKPRINITGLFYQNFFGLDSNKTFSSIEDPELNLLTNINFGKNARELLIVS